MIAIIDYKSGGNIASLKNAIERLGYFCFITSKPKEILNASGVILPGQGRAGTAMTELKKRNIDKIINQFKKPFLGICLGMQLLCQATEEDQIKGFGIFQGISRKFPPVLKVPHIGWNKVRFKSSSPLISNIPDGSYFYFAHSYYVDGNFKEIIAQVSYGFDFGVIFQKRNFYGVQFHPEKSGKQGLRLLNNFCKLCW